MTPTKITLRNDSPFPPSLRTLPSLPGHSTRLRTSVTANKCLGIRYTRFYLPRQEGRTWRVSFEEFEAYPRRWSEQPPRQREEERGKGSEGGGGGGSSEQGPRFVRRDGNKEFIFGGHMRGLFRQSVAVTLQIEIEPSFLGSNRIFRCLPPFFFSFFFSCHPPHASRSPDKKNDGTQTRDINCYLPTCLNYRVIVAFKARPSLVIRPTAFVGFRMQFC